MTFGTSISTCFSKYFDFGGRASRPEFWWFYLFTIIVTQGLLLVSKSQALSGLANLVFFFPIIAAGSRRLHDVNRSGWWQLLTLTVIGLIPLIYWLARKGDKQDNRFGSPV